MSLEGDRQASGSALENSRRTAGTQVEATRRATGSSDSTRQAAGQGLESSRRALGTSLEAERTGSGKQLTDDLNRLVDTKKKGSSLPALEKRGGVAAVTGVGVYNPKNAPSTAGGIAGPLTEADYTQREYWEGALLSSDGLFSIPSIKKLVLTDANGASTIVNLAQPVQPAAAT